MHCPARPGPQRARESERRLAERRGRSADEVRRAAGRSGRRDGGRHAGKLCGCVRPKGGGPSARPLRSDARNSLLADSGARNWSHVARALGGRTGKQVRRAARNGLRRSHGALANIAHILQMLKLRLTPRFNSASQCRERWNNHLAPGINHGEWTPQEEEALVAAHRAYGNRWSAIAAQLPGRTENSVKNHWNAALRRKVSVQRSGGDGIGHGGAASAGGGVAISPSPLRDYIATLSIITPLGLSTKRDLMASPCSSDCEDGAGCSAQLSHSSAQPGKRPLRASRVAAEAHIAAVAAAEIAGAAHASESDEEATLVPYRPAAAYLLGTRCGPGMARVAPVPTAAKSPRVMAPRMLASFRRQLQQGLAGGPSAVKKSPTPAAQQPQNGHLFGSLAVDDNTLLGWPMDNLDDVLLGGSGDISAWLWRDNVNNDNAFLQMQQPAAMPVPVQPAAPALPLAAPSVGAAVCHTAGDERSVPVSPGTPTDAASVITPGGACSVAGPSSEGVTLAPLQLTDCATSPHVTKYPFLDDDWLLPPLPFGASPRAALNVAPGECEWAATMAQELGLLEPPHECCLQPSLRCAPQPPAAPKPTAIRPRVGGFVKTVVPSAQLVQQPCAMVTPGVIASPHGDVLHVQYGPFDGAALIKNSLRSLAPRPVDSRVWETATYMCVIPKPCVAAKKMKHTMHHGTPLAQVPLPAGMQCQIALSTVVSQLRVKWPETAMVVLVLRCDASAPGDVVLCAAVTSPLWAKSISAVTFAVETLKEAMPRLRHAVRAST